MATILEFRKLVEPAGSTTAQVQQTSARAACEIIVFPGVRYERWEEPPVKAKRKSRQKPRDLLEIVV
jgi:hypothetical protein